MTSEKSMAMAAPPSPPDLRVTKRGRQLVQAQPTGTVEIRCRDVFTQLHRTLGGLVTCSQQYSSPFPVPWLTFQISYDQLKDTLLHTDSIAAAISALNLPLPDHITVVHEIASLALSLADPLNFWGYSILVDLEFRYFQEYDESRNLDRLFIQLDGEDTLISIFSSLEMGGPDYDTSSSSSSSRGASTTAIEKLMKKGRVVTGEECDDQELGTCSICLDDFSSSSSCSGVAELIRTPCAHLFHQRCLLRWLEGRNTCPICRRQLDD